MEQESSGTADVARGGESKATTTVAATAEGAGTTAAAFKADTPPPTPSRTRTRTTSSSSGAHMLGSCCNIYFAPNPVSGLQVTGDALLALSILRPGIDFLVLLSDSKEDYEPFVEHSIRIHKLQPYQIIWLARDEFNERGVPNIIGAVAKAKPYVTPIILPSRRSGSFVDNVVSNETSNERRDSEASEKNESVIIRCTIYICGSRRQQDFEPIMRSLLSTTSVGIEFVGAPRAAKVQLHSDVKCEQSSALGELQVQYLRWGKHTKTKSKKKGAGGEDEEDHHHAPDEVANKESRGGNINDHEEDKDRDRDQDAKKPMVRVPRGFICSTHTELLIAYRLLDVEEVTLASLDVGVADMIHLSSTTELKLYDFPSGPVVMYEYVRNDRDDEGIVVSVSVTFENDELLCDVCDEMLLSWRPAGLKPSVRTKEFQEEVLEAARFVMEHHEHVRGAPLCNFLFRSIKGQPVLFSASTNYLSKDYFLKAFAKRRSPQQTFLVVTMCTPEGFTVHKFWEECLKTNLAYVGDLKSDGISVLSYTSGGHGIFCLFGDSEADCVQLRTSLYKILNDMTNARAAEAVEEKETDPDKVPEEGDLEHTSFMNDRVRRIWCFSPKVDSPVRGQRFNLPSRFLSMVRPRKDLIILPGGHQPTAEFVEFIQRTIGIKTWQVIFTPGKHFSMDEDMDQEVLNKISAFVSSAPKDKFVLIPYVTTELFYAWARRLHELNIAVYCESEAWANAYGNKGILHRHMASLDVPAVIETIDSTIRVPPGYVVSNSEQLLGAYELLGVRDVVIKPLNGAAGVGITFPCSADELMLYSFPYGDVLLEAKLELDCAPDGIVLSPALHYLGKKLVGETLVDQIMVGTKYMGWRQSEVNEDFKVEATEVMRKLIKALKPCGPGGVDFLSVNGQPVLSDINTARFNGAHQPKMFVEQYAPGATWMCFKYKPGCNMDVHTFWRRLRERSIAFLPGENTRGVFPISYLRGEAGTFVVVGPTLSQVLNMAESANRLLAPQAPRKPVTKIRQNRMPFEDQRGTPQQADMKGTAAMLPLIAQLDQEKRLSTMLLVRNVTLYDPVFNDNYRNILMGGSTILALLTDGEASALDTIITAIGGLVIDANGLIAIPGFVDIHVHLTGGGGELGFASRTPEVQAKDLVSGGVTTVVGVLGVDMVTRSLENLYGKVEAINEEGITAYMYSGSYHVPGPTLTGDAMKDVALIRQCVGIGEVAIADHRGSVFSAMQLAQLAKSVRVGGMISGKAGITYCHVGNGDEMIDILFECVEKYGVPITNLLPTHMHRSEHLVEQGIKWVEKGGYIDLTGRSSAARKFLDEMKNKGVNMNQVICSSDAHGSLPTFDEDGKLLRYTVADCGALLRLVKNLYFENLWDLEMCCRVVATNPAEFFNFTTKGSIAPGKDADILLLDRVDLSLKYTIAKGKVLKSPTWVKADFVASIL